jgi:hypothetical protein
LTRYSAIIFRHLPHILLFGILHPKYMHIHTYLTFLLNLTTCNLCMHASGMHAHINRILHLYIPKRHMCICARTNGLIHYCAMRGFCVHMLVLVMYAVHVRSHVHITCIHSYKRTCTQAYYAHTLDMHTCRSLLSHAKELLQATPQHTAILMDTHMHTCTRAGTGCHMPRNHHKQTLSAEFHRNACPHSVGHPDNKWTLSRSSDCTSAGPISCCCCGLHWSANPFCEASVVQERAQTFAGVGGYVSNSCC